MPGRSGSLINAPYGEYLDHGYAKNLQTHFLCIFVANIKVDAIYAFYPESSCNKSLANRKVFVFSDSANLLSSVGKVTWLQGLFATFASSKLS